MKVIPSSVMSVRLIPTSPSGNRYPRPSMYSTPLTGSEEPSSQIAGVLELPFHALPAMIDPSVLEATIVGWRKVGPKLLRLRRPVSNDHAKPDGSAVLPRDGST